MNLENDYKTKISLKHRQKFAQFFTPQPIAELMVNWLLGNNNLVTILEPAFGLGIFTRLFLAKKTDLKITGFEIDLLILTQAKAYFQDNCNLNLQLKDYLFNDWENQYDGIICNPPYFKFHDYNNQVSLQEIKTKLNINLKGFTNIYSLFLLKSIYQLKEGGRGAYLIPSEFLNSDYGKNIKEYLIKSQTLREIIIFDFQKNIFEQVLTTSAIILFAKDSHSQNINFTTITNQNQLDQIHEIINNYPNHNPNITIKQNDLNPQIKWRNYYQKQASLNYQKLIPFHQVAKVVRGIATGANDYFIFNLEKAEKYQINIDYLLPCITKSKDIINAFFTLEDFERLKANNRNIYLLNVGKNPTDQNVLKYLKMGEENKINQKYLTSKRKPWYLLENRQPSPIFVSVFNRSKIKFILNEAKISNLTNFHCVYVKNDLYKINLDLLFAYLLTDIAQQIFNDNRREYGDGLTKFEPNDLNFALILDLSLLDHKTENLILQLYQKYRYSVITNQENKQLINEIDLIFKNYFIKSNC